MREFNNGLQHTAEGRTNGVEGSGSVGALCLEGRSTRGQSSRQNHEGEREGREWVGARDMGVIKTEGAYIQRRGKIIEYLIR